MIEWYEGHSSSWLIDECEQPRRRWRFPQKKDLSLAMQQTWHKAPLRNAMDKSLHQPCSHVGCCHAIGRFVLAQFFRHNLSCGLCVCCAHFLLKKVLLLFWLSFPFHPMLQVPRQFFESGSFGGSNVQPAMQNLFESVSLRSGRVELVAKRAHCSIWRHAFHGN